MAGLLWWWVAAAVAAALCCRGRGEDLKYPFMTEDLSKAANGVYDYIIVGGGAAGCALASTLSEKYKVLLLERGRSPYGVSEIERLDNFGAAFAQTDNYTSIAQAVHTEDGVLEHRGRALGGGTTINAGFYSRGSDNFTALMGWDAADVDAAYDWVEETVAFQQPLRGWSGVLRQGLHDIGVLPDHGFTMKHLEGTKIGAWIFDLNGTRHTSADLLAKGDAANLLVVLNATVTRILFRGTAAVGVEVQDQQLQKQTVQLRPRQDGSGSASTGGCRRRHRSEVILSAGAIGTPQVLMLSGVGPADDLRRLNITPVLDQPQVGKHVTDSPRASVNIVSPTPLAVTTIQVAGILKDSTNYIMSSAAVSANVSTGTIFQKVAFPASEGEVRLVTTDPRDNPSVRFNFYKEPQDVRQCVFGVRYLDRLLRSPALRPFAVGGETTASGRPRFNYSDTPFPDSDTDEAYAEYCRKVLAPMWHYHGGSLVGSVTDRQYRVVGLRNVRVVDGSLFPVTPGTNPQATTMMLGRYAGVRMLRRKNMTIVR